LKECVSALWIKPDGAEYNGSFVAGTANPFIVDDDVDCSFKAAVTMSSKPI
jgi:hypothetical protein